MTFAHLLTLIESLKPELVYGTTDMLAPGTCLRVPGNDFVPSFWLFHPDDIDTVRHMFPVRMIHIADWRALP